MEPGGGGAAENAPVGFDLAAYHPPLHHHYLGPMDRHVVEGDYAEDVVLRDPAIHFLVSNRSVSEFAPISSFIFLFPCLLEYRSKYIVWF